MMNGALNNEHRAALEELAGGSRAPDNKLAEAARNALRLIDRLWLQRKRHAKSFSRWTPAEDACLYEMWADHLPAWMIGERLGRSEHAVRERLKRLVKHEGYEPVDRPGIIERQHSLNEKGGD